MDWLAGPGIGGWAFAWRWPFGPAATEANLSAARAAPVAPEWAWAATPVEHRERAAAPARAATGEHRSADHSAASTGGRHPDDDRRLVLDDDDAGEALCAASDVHSIAAEPLRATQPAPGRRLVRPGGARRFDHLDRLHRPGRSGPVPGGAARHLHEQHADARHDVHLRRRHAAELHRFVVQRGPVHRAPRGPGLRVRAPARIDSIARWAPTVAVPPPARMPAFCVPKRSWPS